ncbi:MAG: hypothetical protein DRQ13_05245 [Ignavibacteriae bacterium]|nr:MAG: hypothetical protein DRQ13_05245 [Ignavibacteriota bacterium]
MILRVFKSNRFATVSILEEKRGLFPSLGILQSDLSVPDGSKNLEKNSCPPKLQKNTGNAAEIVYKIYFSFQVYFAKSI